ncbi:MAG: hypothetical protein J6Z36_01595, partial [Clostridia bacterium]|nr:hypothetical protein [Clostridia bacterium]
TICFINYIITYVTPFVTLFIKNNERFSQKILFGVDTSRGNTSPAAPCRLTAGRTAVASPGSISASLRGSQATEPARFSLLLGEGT